MILNNIPTTLTIAGSDSGAGAGIQADLKTFAALNCYGTSVITAVTAQNTQGVHAVYPLPSNIISAQIDSVLEDIGANAIKVGMLYNPTTIQAVADKLKHFQGPIVVDPVMVAKGGQRLLLPDAVEALKELLFPLATLITPNIPESEILVDIKIQSHDDFIIAAQALKEFGSKAILIKGGHLTQSDDSGDVLFITEGETMEWFKQRRIETNNNHGTGCTLSSAITAYLAHGEDIITAVKRAKSYLSEVLITSKNLNIGRGPAKPMWHIG